MALTDLRASRLACRSFFSHNQLIYFYTVMYDNAGRSNYDTKQSTLWLVGARLYARNRFLANELRAGTLRGGEYFTRIYVAFHAANTAVV